MLMSTINYPTLKRNVGNTESKGTYGGRGTRLENDVNESNTSYRTIDKALIYKKPTPIQVVHVDYPARNKARIDEAYYRTPSTTDYNGIYRGQYIDFEAKETKNKTSFPMFMIHAHQIDHLKKVQLHKGIGFFIIRFTYYNETYLVDAPVLIQHMETSEKRSIPYTWFKENGHLIQEGYRPRLSYLSVVDQVYFEKGDVYGHK